MAEEGKLDGELVDLFEQSGVWKRERSISAKQQGKTGVTA
jgi:hypothetical protein